MKFTSKTMPFVVSDIRPSTMNSVKSLHQHCLLYMPWQHNSLDYIKKSQSAPSEIWISCLSKIDFMSKAVSI